RRHQTDVPWFVDLAELDLAVAENLSVALRPSDGLLAGLDLEQQHRRGQLVFAAIRTLLDRALPVAEDQTGSRPAGTEARAVDQPTGFGMLADERAHLVDDVHWRRFPCFGVRIVFVHHHETHGRLLIESGTGSYRRFHEHDDRQR